MSLCGCYPACSCQLNIGTPALLSLLGTGDPATGGWTLSAIETVFAATAANNAIGITPGGSFGHNPSFGLNIVDTDTVDLSIGENGLSADIRLDPDATGAVTVGPNGLKIDCCAEGGVNFTVDNEDRSVILDLDGAVLSGDVKPDTLHGIEVGTAGVAVKLQNDPAAVAAQPENRLAFTTAGDLVTIQDGMNLRSRPDSISVTVPFSAGGDTVAFVDNITNSSGTDIVLEYCSTPFLVMKVKPSPPDDASYSFDINLRTDVTNLVGGAVAYGNNPGHGIRVSNMEAPGFVPSNPATGNFYNPAGEFVWSSPITSTIFMPAGSTCSVTGIIETIRAISTLGWEQLVGNGTYFKVYNRFMKIYPARTGTARAVTP